MGKIYTVPEIAKLCKLTRQRIYQLIMVENIPHKRHGYIYIIKQTEFNKYFKARVSA